MKNNTTEFIKLIDQALEIAEHTSTEAGKQERLNKAIATLKSIRSQTLAGNLEPSGGISTLGLASGVADWIEPLDSPLLAAVGAIEEHYQKHL
ncbi:hypothetical protein [Calothrix sp. PCC 7507]|uniref:hypothetical protein n=1 Tax=Calothrix sp. PCC 7507 TaxID=99598 RepID=UPI00029F472C|nr:hypothetical protein [Calothrix sp. PCC 7507]AFY32990.1 hypothetical protein Cal7507_2566 [Calothrix sp. PCC 7507]